MLWGYPLQFWQTVVFWLWFVTATTGGLAIVASFGSSVISYYISDATETAAKIQIDEAKADAGRANAAAEATRLRIVDSERALEQERLARLKLEEQVQWRHLTAEQCERISKYGKIGNIVREVWVTAVKTDNESISYAESIANCLSSSGVKAVGPFPTWDRAVGLSVLNDKDEQKSFLVEALKEAGLELKDLDDSPYPMQPNWLEIVVGSKPPR